MDDGCADVASDVDADVSCFGVLSLFENDSFLR